MNKIEELRSCAKAAKRDLDRLIVLIDERDHEPQLEREEAIYPSGEMIEAQVNS